MNASRTKRIKTKVPMFQFPIKLDLGCGPSDHIKPGFVGLDLNDYGQQIVWDMEVGLPLPDNSCSEINASQIFEHLEDLIGVMNECHRVLRTDGLLSLDVPSKDHAKAYLLSHIRRFDKYTFDFFQHDDYANEYGSSLWEVLEIETDKENILYVKMRPKK